MVTRKSASKPLEKVYRAYKAVRMTDGIQTWIIHRHDFTVAWDDWTAADKAELDADRRDAPLERIEDMQAMLATLPADNPAIRLHADAIRAILAELLTPPVIFNKERHARLDQASELWGKILVIRDVMPKAKTGQKFTQGRKVGTESPIKKAVRKTLKANPLLKTLEVWRILAKAPPRNWSFLENRLGRYIEGPSAAEGMKYGRFQNLCSEIRAELKSK